MCNNNMNWTKIEHKMRHVMSNNCCWFVASIFVHSVAPCLIVSALSLIVVLPISSNSKGQYSGHLARLAIQCINTTISLQILIHSNSNITKTVYILSRLPDSSIDINFKVDCDPHSESWPTNLNMKRHLQANFTAHKIRITK